MKPAAEIVTNPLKIKSKMTQKNEIIITVFGSAFTQPDDELYKSCIEIGNILSKNGFTVCSGGYGGTMEAVSKGAKQNNGKTLGVTVQNWDRKTNEYIDENIKMSNLMERMTELIALGDAYIILPGGTGTLLEIASALELMNKRLMKEKIMVFYTSHWKQVIETLKKDSKNLSNLIERNVKYTNSPAGIIKELQNIHI
jgi:uncharacterized protein (TIGR00730 family)